MRYCPKCRGEYQEWVKKCLDCGVELVDILPETGIETEPQIITKGNRSYRKEPLVAVASFASSMEAQFIKGVLESEGIDSVITNADNVLLTGRNSSTVKGINLVVKESDAEKAREILNSIEKDIKEEDFPEEEIIEPDISGESRG